MPAATLTAPVPVLAKPVHQDTGSSRLPVPKKQLAPVVVLSALLQEVQFCNVLEMTGLSLSAPVPADELLHSPRTGIPLEVDWQVPWLGGSFTPSPHTVTVTTDATLERWGGHAQGSGLHSVLFHGL